MQEFIQKYFNIDAAPAATIIITLTVFILGFLLNGLLRLLSQYSLRKKNRTLFIKSLASLNKSLEKAQEAITDTTDSIDIRKNGNWTLSHPEFFQILIFKEMGYKDIFQAYFTGLENSFKLLRGKKYAEARRDSFNKIYANISQIEFWANNLFTNYSSFSEKYNSFGNKRNEAITRLRIYWEQLSTKTRKDLNRNEVDYLDKLFLIIREFKLIPTHERVNPFTTHRKLVLPIRILNKKSLLKVDIRQFNDIALETSNCYYNMEMFIRAFKGQIKLCSDSLNEIYDSNIKIIRVLK